MALTLILLLGAGVRLSFLTAIDLDKPYEEGGLFIEFARQIAANGYGLPDRIPFYSEGGIPFAYPPLGFYLLALLTDGLGLPTLPVANLLSPLIGTLALPSLYLLASALGLGRTARLGALFAYGVLPMATHEVLSTAGIAEATGALTLIWFATALTRVYQRGRVRDYVLAGMAWAVTILASPGTAYASVPIVMILFLALVARETRFQHLLSKLVLMGLIAALLSSPYWGTVVSRHGISVFVDSIRGQYGDSVASTVRELAKDLVRSDFSGSRYPLVWDASILLGLVFFLLERRQWCVPLWFVALWLIPREGWWLSAVPASLLAGATLGEVAIPIVATRFRDTWRQRGHSQLDQFVLRLCLLGLAAALLVPAVVDAYATVNSSRRREPLRPELLEALDWINTGLPHDARLIVLHPDLKVLEWTPYFARRTVINETFGTEWEPAEFKQADRFNRRVGLCRQFDCVYAIMRESGYNYAEYYLLLSREWYEWLTADTDPDAEFGMIEPVFENDGIFIGRAVVQTGTNGDSPPG